MEHRIKWLHSPSIDAATLGTIGAAMQRNSFRRSSSRGFILTEVRPRAITGRFIEKLEGTRVFTDPFGASIEVPFVTFETTTFRLGASSPEVELIDPPRSAKRFLNHLEELLSATVTIQSIQRDPVAWLNNLVPVFGAATVSELGCKNLSLSPTLAADMDFTGSGDVLKSAQKYLGDAFRQVRFVRATFDLGNRTLEAEIFDSGSVKLNSPLDARVISAFRQGLVAE